MILEKIKTMINDQMGVDPETITLQTNIVKDLQADSLDKIEMIMAAEEEFGIAIDDDSALQFVTIGDVVDYIEKNIKK